MNLFEKCKVSVSGSCLQHETGAELLIDSENTATHLTVPEFIEHETITPKQRVVFYISDLHLVHHIIKRFPDGGTDEEIFAFIHGIVLEMFNGELGEAVRRFESPVVMFGGDTASSFHISKAFYRDFVAAWEDIVDERYCSCSSEIAPIKSELDKVSEQYSDWKEKHPWFQNARKPIEEYSDKKVPEKVKKQYRQMNLLKEQHIKKREELGLRACWESDYQESRKHQYIYAILGNHELWDFDSYDSCVSAYDRLFKKCGIRFICDCIDWLGPHRSPCSAHFNSETKIITRTPLKRKDNPEEYDRQMFDAGNLLVVGGIGFAEMNSSFNANAGIYGDAVNREEELVRCAAWRELYHKALAAAKTCYSSLVVFTHMPVSDWAAPVENTSNCVFFSGHTHRNIAYGAENNNYYLADNQVGYDGENYRFKKAILHLPRDPFAADPDGFREISCDEYREYYRFVQEPIPGTGIIERHTKNCGSRLFVMKQSGYVGFFMVGPKAVYICNGGQIRKIGISEPLDRYYLNFKSMIDKYITALTPLRRAQKKVSAYIKSFGGEGTIHGTIVDIDYWNHIMFNTVDGTMTAYNSPMLGSVKAYPDIGALIHAHCPELEDRYLALGNGKMLTIAKEFSNHNGSYEKIDIKNSPYALSRRVNALQRLFDKRILRDWNPALEIFLLDK